MATTSAISSISFLIIPILILFVLFIGLIVLQVFLSRAKNKVLGLILPIITFVIGLFVSVTMLFYIGGGVLSSSFILSLMMQIPTIIFLLIYLIVRAVIKNRDKTLEQLELEKMNIQDL